MNRGRRQSGGYWYSYDHCGGGIPGSHSGGPAAEFSGVPGWAVIYTRLVYLLAQFHGAILFSSSRRRNISALIVAASSESCVRELIFLCIPASIKARLAMSTEVVISASHFAAAAVVLLAQD